MEGNPLLLKVGDGGGCSPEAPDPYPHTPYPFFLEGGGALVPSFFMFSIHLTDYKATSIVLVNNENSKIYIF